MSKDEIIEGNRLIAGFMGVPTEMHGNFLKTTEFFGNKLVEYHSSWDWLMSVVINISKLPAVKGKVLEQINWYENIVSGLMNLDIIEVWERSVNYIKWYNTQQQSK